MGAFNFLIFFFALVFLGASAYFFKITYKDFYIKGELQEPSVPVYYVLCFLVSYGLWSWIDFKGALQFGQIGNAVYLIYLMFTALAVMRNQRYDLLVPHIVVILGIGVMHVTHMIQETQEITVDNFTYKMVDYVEALQNEDVNALESVVDKYKDRKIPSAAILQFLPVTDKQSYLLLVKKGVFDDSHEFERFLIHVYKRTSPVDQEILEAYAPAALRLKEQGRRDFMFYLFYTPSELGSAQRAKFLEKLSEGGLKPDHFKMHPDSYLLVDLVNEINILSPTDLKERLDFLKIVLPEKEKFLPTGELNSFQTLLDREVHELSARGTR